MIYITSLKMNNLYQQNRNQSSPRSASIMMLMAHNIHKDKHLYLLIGSKYSKYQQVISCWFYPLLLLRLSASISKVKWQIYNSKSNVELLSENWPDGLVAFTLADVLVYLKSASHKAWDHCDHLWVEKTFK